MKEKLTMSKQDEMDKWTKAELERLRGMTKEEREAERMEYVKETWLHLCGEPLMPPKEHEKT